MSPNPKLNAKHYIDPASVADFGKPVLFLDRDGVINRDVGYVGKRQDFVWMSGIFSFCRAAHHAGFALAVVTNQSGIARGFYSEDTFLELTRYVHEEFASQRIPIASTWYCPHHPDLGGKGAGTDCTCRKPRPGLLLAAAEFHQFDLNRSIMIGDRQSDMEAASAAGVALRFSVGAQSLEQIQKVCGF